MKTIIHNIKTNQMKKTATKLKTLAIMLLLGVISSCEWMASEDDKIPELITISYLDFSTSQDTASINSMTHKLLQVIENQPGNMNTTFIVRAIHKDSGIDPIIKLTSTAVNEASFVDKRTHSNKRKSDQELVKEAIAKYLKKEKPDGRDETCICNSLENSIKDLVLIDSSVNIRLIVFSDLFEECGKGSSYISGGLSMCRTNSGIKRKISTLKEIIASDYNPTNRLSDYVRPENLYFILTQSDDYNESSRMNSKCLNDIEKTEAWKAILIKLGYSESDFNHQNGIAFSTSLPDRLIKNHQKMPTKKAIRYDVALSFATENQEVAHQLYHALVKKKLSVYLYQKENQWAMELNQITQRIYYSHSSTALVILSKDYVQNRWTNKEWNTLLRAKNRGKIKSIFILRLDQSTIHGLGDSLIYQEWNDNSDKLARDIKKRIGSTSSHLKLIMTIIALISITLFIILLLTSG